MLTFNLKKQWFDKIKSGEKTHEYREVKPYWTNRLANFLDLQDEDFKVLEYSKLIFQDYLYFCFRLGYTKEYLEAYIVSLAKVNGKNTDLAVDKNVYDIEFCLVRDDVN